MIEVKTARLADRSVVSVSGDDARKFLQGIITGDMDRLPAQPAIHAGLLTPQGKLLFEFFVAESSGGFLLDTGRDQVAGLVKRLSMYNLRSKVDLRDVSDERCVLAVWGGEPPGLAGTTGALLFPDPRLAALGLRVLAEAAVADRLAATLGARGADPESYDAHRIALGVPEAGKDYALGDTFPHEANFDLLNGVSFSKGCFVGQEVVSRMQHRGTARKRIMIVASDQPLRTGADVAAGQAVIGTVGSVAGNRALALLRLDRVEEAQAKGQPLTAGGAAITVQRPLYMAGEAMAGTQ